jgi:cell division septum initiation protein DivIVA
VELTRLHQENDDLRSKLATAPAARPAATATPSSDGDRPAAPAVRTIPEAAGAAARLLEIAGENAEQLVSEAHDNADKILSEATIKAERLEAESKAKAEALQTEAQSRSERLDQETAERRQQLLSALERDRENLASELEHLRVFEREYRSRLRGYFESQLRALDDDAAGSVQLAQSGSERGLRGLLAEDADSAEGDAAESEDTEL